MSERDLTVTEVWPKIRRDWFPDRTPEEHMAALAAHDREVAAKVLEEFANTLGMKSTAPTRWIFDVQDLARNLAARLRWRAA